VRICPKRDNTEKWDKSSTRRGFQKIWVAAAISEVECVLTSDGPKSIRFLPSLYPHPILWEETLNTRNNLTSYWNRLTTSLLAPNTGIPWKVPKQNPDQAVHFPPSSSPHHLCQRSQFAGVESIFVSVTITPTHFPLPLTLNCENPLRSCNPKEEYITCVTAALQNLALRSRALSRDNRQKGPPL
jgi:hypothetical protein